LAFAAKALTLAPRTSGAKSAMKRREFITLVGGAAAWPLVARAQQPSTMKRIAIVHPNIDVRVIGVNSGNPYYRALFAELERLGYVEGQNLQVDRYSGEGHLDRFDSLASEVVRTKPDVIFAIANALALSFKRATTSIPIVILGGDVVLHGITESIARPGKNITGINAQEQSIYGKRMSLLRDAVPRLSNLGLMTLRTFVRPDGPLPRQAKDNGFSFTYIPLEGRPDEGQITQAFALMERDKVDGLIVTDDPTILPHKQLIVELAASYRIPTIYANRAFAEIGGLMTYVLDYVEAFRHVALQISEVLKGANPGDIPFYQPNRYELMINLKTAKALDLELPATLLASATQVIE
jgi:putative tryptophan/tyrosine transport system substrate-binding protein